jgi:hypothetical protein
MSNIAENYCCDDGDSLTPGYGGGCLVENKENYLVERRGGGGGGHGGGRSYGGRGGYGGGYGGGWGWGYYPYYTYDDGTYYDNCPENFHYDPNHPKADSNGCVKDSDICPPGSHYHPEHSKADPKTGCMKDSDMVEKYTKLQGQKPKKMYTNVMVFLGIFFLIFLLAIILNLI